MFKKDFKVKRDQGPGVDTGYGSRARVERSSVVCLMTLVYCSQPEAASRIWPKE
jgi:hypothetical protein